jgi:DNA mismatch repair protein MutS
MSEMTPMMRQYRRIKEKYHDAVVFFRLGDFYEMFERDAAEVSAILGLTLTARHGVPMCGIPYHAFNTYVPRLLKAGRKIAVCEQVSLPENGKGLAEREVVEVLTPGTILEEDYLDRSRNNYLMALGTFGDRVSLSYADVSTGEFAATSFSFEERSEKLRREMMRLSPSEVLVQESFLEEDEILGRILNGQDNLYVNRFPDWSFDLKLSRDRVLGQLGVVNLHGFGIEDDDPALFSCGVLLEYLEDNARSALPQVKDFRVYTDNDFLGLDEATQRNLEIVRNMHDGGKQYTLLHVIDYTRTAPGSRKLRTWLLHPLLQYEPISRRQESVEYFYRNQMLLSSLRDAMKRMPDLERLSARIAMEKAHAKDLLAVKEALGKIERMIEILKDSPPCLVAGGDIRDDEGDLQILRNFIDSAIADDPSVTLSDGNLIKQGFAKELDRLNSTKENSRQMLKEYLEEEKAVSGIQNLRIKYNKIIGHFLEVTKSNIEKVPEHFIRRQSLVGSERYTTDRLSELETELNTASERAVEMEREIFLSVRCKVREQIDLLMRGSNYIGVIDCLQSFAQAATVRGYTRPELSEEIGIRIEDGRHPVVEAYLPAGEFVPNSICTDPHTRLHLITGPNMAGKSTVLRQTGLIVLMAQIGSFVPAREAVIGCVDKIFCRVGASDNLARGESTFLVEMNETANILRSATERSLVIMDEVGRGTGTNDGLSIAWSVTEYLLDKVNAMTLFATHYHELTTLDHTNLKNVSMDVAERDGEVIFLKRIKDGPAENSYGIHVAKIAGLPDVVIQRASDLLLQFESFGSDRVEVPVRRGSDTTTQDAGMQHTNSENTKADNNGSGKRAVKNTLPQGGLFDPGELIIREIQSIDHDNLTPLDALIRISAWKRELKDRTSGF